MNSSYTTANMSLVVPVVGVEVGPNWANDLNSSLTILDSHSHVPGSGVPITPLAININSNLPMNGNNLISINALTFLPTSTAPSVGSLYETGIDLYYIDGNGNVIRLTQSGSVTGSSGTITGLPSGTASASYGSSTFTFQSATNTGATIDAASYILRNNTANSFGLTLQPPNSLGTNYSLTLPLVPAVSNSVVLLDTSGNMTTGAPQNYFLPPGMIQAYGGTSIPNGWLLCDGSAVSRTTYAALFSAIGTAYGYGDQTTTFNVPFCEGQFLRGVNAGGGFDPDASSRTASGTGGNTGNNVGSFQASAVIQHAHAVSDPTHNHSYSNYNTGVGQTQSGAPPISYLVNIANSGSFNTGNSSTGISIGNVTNLPGGTATLETRPNNLYVYFMIKT
jgi:microcystin-dependent protein